MRLETETVEIRKLIADEGFDITDIETERLRAKTVFLATGDSQDNYKEIPEDTPIPEITDKQSV